MSEKTVSVELTEFEAVALVDLCARVRSNDLFHLGLTHEAAAFALLGLHKVSEALRDNTRTVKPAQKLCQSCPDRTCAGADNARSVEGWHCPRCRIEGTGNGAGIECCACRLPLVAGPLPRDNARSVKGAGDADAL